MKFELKTCQFAFRMFRNIMNFARAPLWLQRAIKSNEARERRERGGCLTSGQKVWADQKLISGNGQPGN
jgi:hypothetical protein